MKTILITGGAGYIGSQVAWTALDSGHDVVVLDDLSTGLREAVPPAAAFVHGDVTDARELARTLREREVAAVLHFAGRVVAPESVQRPLDYYESNVGGTAAVARACAEAGVRRVVLSSTAAVYGDGRVRVGEGAPPAPVSPYGRSKLMAEQVLADAAAAHGLAATALRYFNVAGADPAGRTGQSAVGATHLFKAACAAATGSAPHLKVFGEDWPTRDGTGVRDFVHVADLARAHLLALDLPQAPGAFEVYNLGSERGYTVLEVARAVSRAAGAPIPLRPFPRRAGDLGELVADASLAMKRLRWRPVYGVAEMAEHALAWERRLMHDVQPPTPAARAGYLAGRSSGA